MTYYYCEHEWEAMLTCIYEAWSSRRGQQNIKLCFLPITQYSLFDEYIEVQADTEKALKVIDAVNRRISAEFYRQIAYCAMAYDEDALDTIFRVMLLGFHFGPSALEMIQYEPVFKCKLLHRNYSNEVHHFREFIRFHEIQRGAYVSIIEPKSHVVMPLGDIFADRMPSEHFMIVDKVHCEAIVHPADESCYFRKLSEDELSAVTATEEAGDEFTDLWKVFFDSIAIKERINPRCQNNLFPKWLRKHAVEFRQP